MAILDRHGRPYGSSELYRSPGQHSPDFRPVARPRAKTYEAVSAWQRREMVDISRVIAAGVPNMDTALIQAGEYAIGDSWHVKSRSANKAWGAKRDEWFNQTFAWNCNLRGEMNDWWSSLRQLNWTRKVEGDYAIVFDGAPYRDSTGKEHDPSGQFYVVKFDRINTGLNGAAAVGNGLQEVKEVGRNTYSNYMSNGWGGWVGMYVINDPASPFDGCRILDGVIVDANMRVLGYRVTGFNEGGSPIYADVPKAQMHLNFSARRQVDLIRGIPELAEAILPIMHLDDIQHLISMAVKLASALAVTRESADGNPSRGGRNIHEEEELTPTGVPVKVKRAVEEIYPGIIELATNNKEALKALEFDRPSMNEEAFVNRVETSILHKFWPRSLIYAGDTGRAGTRAIAQQAQTICSWDQKCTERSARWILNRSTAFGMAAGFIPGNNNLADAYEAVFTVPGRFTVDEGNDMKMRLSALGRCCISHGMITELDGYLFDEVLEEKGGEVDAILLKAEELQGRHKDFSVKEIALMLDTGESQISFADNSKADWNSEAPEDGSAPNAEPGTRNAGKNGARNGHAALARS